MENKVAYSFGLVEGFLELLLKEGDVTVIAVLENLKVIETAYQQMVTDLAKSRQTLEEVQLNLNGWKKI
jgi:hypothetical protein